MNLLRRRNNKEPRAFFSLEKSIYSVREEIEDSESKVVHASEIEGRTALERSEAIMDNGTRKKSQRMGRNFSVRGAKICTMTCHDITIGDLLLSAK
jgi:hypothetical protein